MALSREDADASRRSRSWRRSASQRPLRLPAVLGHLLRVLCLPRGCAPWGRGRVASRGRGPVASRGGRFQEESESAHTTRNDSPRRLGPRARGASAAIYIERAGHAESGVRAGAAAAIPARGSRRKVAAGLGRLLRVLCLAVLFVCHYALANKALAAAAFEFRMPGTLYYYNLRPAAAASANPKVAW